MLELQADLSAHLDLTTQLHLECAYVSWMYYDHKSGREHLQKAQELAGLDINLTGAQKPPEEPYPLPPGSNMGNNAVVTRPACVLEGALGKRTHFQQKLLAQLVLQVQRRDDWSRRTCEDSPTCTLPSLLPKVSCGFRRSGLVCDGPSFRRSSRTAV